MQKHKQKRELVHDGMEKSNHDRLLAFEDEVRWMELRVQKRNLQNKLMEVAVEDRIDALIDIEINIAARHPEVLPGLIEERNLFLTSVGIPEEKYLEALQKDIAGREEQNKGNVPPAEPLNPSEQLHSIANEIQEPEEGKELKEAIADIPTLQEEHVSFPEPAIEPIDVTGGATNEEEIPVIPMTELGVKESDIF